MIPLEKSLTATGISVAAGCRPCTTYHLKAAREAGATDSDIQKVVDAAVCVRNSATEEMRRHALGLPVEAEGCGCTEPTRLGELVSLGAALAVNSASNVEKHLSSARRVGVEDQEIGVITGLVWMIRGKATSTAEAVIGVQAATEPEQRETGMVGRMKSCGAEMKAMMAGGTSERRGCC